MSTTATPDRFTSLLLGRFSRPQEVANVALFLACDESSYVTGVDLVVDDGMKVWRPPGRHT